MKKIILGISIATFAVSCNNNESGDGNLHIEAPNINTIYVSQLSPTSINTLDTLTSKSGSFNYQIEKDTSDFFMVGTPSEYRIPIFTDGTENINITIIGQGDSTSYSVEGSPATKRVRTINQVTEDAMAVIDSLNKENQRHQGSEHYPSVRASLDSTFEATVENASRKLKDLIEEKPGSMANLFVFTQAIGNFQLMDPTEDMEYFYKVRDGLQENYPGNKHTASFVKQVKNIEASLARQKEMEKAQSKLKPGTEAPNIVMNDPQGNKRSLKDLRGKVVLIDFWAAWCKPCRMENPNLVRTYKDYKDQGFEVFSVSLDGLRQQPNPRQNWLNAIKADKLTWDNHVSDLKGWGSPIVQKYGFQGIPFTVLIDREGEIIATKLRGNALRQKLKELFNS